MKLGDIVNYEGRFWLAASYDPKRTRTAVLLGQDGTSREVPHDTAVEVVGNPSEDWPFVAAPVKPRAGAVRSLSWPGRDLALTMYRDWMPSEPARAGGSIFLNPALRLQIGDYLLAEHHSGFKSRLIIPANFGTVRQRQARAAAKGKVEPERTAYTRLLDDDHFGDDD
jgi:hypothetical protein